MYCFRANTWYRSENPPAVCVFVRLVLIPSSTYHWVDHFNPTRYLSHLPAGVFLLPAAKRKQQRRKIYCLWSKIMEAAHHKSYLALKRDQCINLYVEYWKTLNWFIRPPYFTQNYMCATSDKNTNFNISKYMLCKAWFQFLYPEVVNQ